MEMKKIQAMYNEAGEVVLQITEGLSFDEKQQLLEALELELFGESYTDMEEKKNEAEYKFEQLQQDFDEFKDYKPIICNESEFL